ncbi:MAG: hypothetical protein MJE63_03405 [Proteobacteria bacterium]|nr:hypothetical protein [Pseudomonadota bacterium]
MKKLMVLLLGFAALVFANHAFAGSELALIGKKGDQHWNKLVAEYKQQNKFVDHSGTKAIVGNFARYQGKVKQFPRFEFNDFVTDKNGDKYFYSDNKGTLNFFVIKHNKRINEKLQVLSSALGSLKGDWQVLGTIEDAYTWWGDIVLMDMIAMRIPGKACVVVNNGEATLIGQDILDKAMAEREKSSKDGIPKNLTSVPSGLDAETVAKLFFYVSSVEKNQEVWKDLLVPYALGNNKSLKGRSKSWWRNLTTKNREYFFVRENPGRVRKPGEKCFMFQIKANGKNIGTAKPTMLTQVNGEWKVRSAVP